MSARVFTLEYAFLDERNDTVLLVTSPPGTCGYKDWAVHTRKSGQEWTFVSVVQAERTRSGETTMIGKDIKIYHKHNTVYWIQHKGIQDELDQLAFETDVDAFDDAYDRIESYPRNTLTRLSDVQLEPDTIQVLSKYHDHGTD